MNHGPHNKRMDWLAIVVQTEGGDEHHPTSLPFNTRWHDVSQPHCHCVAHYEWPFRLVLSTTEHCGTTKYTHVFAPSSKFPKWKDGDRPQGTQMWGSHEKVSFLLIPNEGSRRCPLLALWSKYSPQLPNLKHPQFVTFPYCTKSKQDLKLQELENSHHATARTAENRSIPARSSFFLLLLLLLFLMSTPALRPTQAYSMGTRTVFP